MRSRSYVSAVLLGAAMVAAGLGTTGAQAGPAIDQFEVRGLDVERGEVEFEVQSDFIPGRGPRRKFVKSEDGEVEFDDNEVAKQRHELELGYGVTDWLKLSVSGEFEQERIDDPTSFRQARDFDDLDFTEVSGEAVAVLIPVKNEGVGLGLVTTLQVPVRSEARTFFIGPIVQAVSGRWSATGNFEFVKFFGGKRETDENEEGEIIRLPRDEKWDFAYFTQLKYQASNTMALALEAYGTIDRLGNSGTPSEAAQAIGDQDQHRIGPVVYFTFASPAEADAKNDDDKADTKGEDKDNDDNGRVTLSAGVLFGLNDNTPDTTIKTGLEVEF